MYQVEPIAIVTNSRREVEDDDWGSVVSEIELMPPLDQKALLGLETFSHAEVASSSTAALIFATTTKSQAPWYPPAGVRLRIAGGRP